MSPHASPAIAAVPFRSCSRVRTDADMRRGLLLESKSLPRSGLHYMKNLLSRALGDRFSFCEWYYEPGCCREMPCTGGSSCTSGSARKAGIRLTKSHDFELSDPVYAPGDDVMRVILVRDPLYILTSWYSLEFTSRYFDRLVEAGIDAREIWHRHERSLLERAFSVIDTVFEEPAVVELQNWLDRQSAYIAAFLEKWALPAVERPMRGVTLVPYHEIGSFVRRFVTGYGIEASGIDSASGEVFRPRTLPYASPSPRVSAYLESNSRLFERYASRIRAIDRCMMIPALHGYAAA